MMSELKPCPFCGAKAELMRFKKGCRVICDSDGCVNSAKEVLFFADAQAIAAWNMRVGEKQNVKTGL